MKILLIPKSILVNVKKIMKIKFPVCLQQKLKYKNYESVNKWVSVKITRN
jgi:hypothetical protein